MKNILKALLPAACLSLASLAMGAGEKIIYQSEGKEFEGFILRSQNIKSPAAILMIHNWMGVSAETETQAKRYHALGYTVMAADIYGKGIRPKDMKEAAALATLYKNDRPLFRKRLQLGYETLKAQTGIDPSKIVVMGYCFGGTGALELARTGAELKASISFHGGLDSLNPSDAQKIKGKVLVLHGADDPFVPKKDVDAFLKELKDYKVDHTFIAYPGAVHSFTEKGMGNDPKKGAAYNASADKDSFEKTKKLLAEVL